MLISIDIYYDTVRDNSLVHSLWAKSIKLLYNEKVSIIIGIVLRGDRIYRLWWLK